MFYNPTCLTRRWLRAALFLAPVLASFVLVAGLAQTAPPAPDEQPTPTKKFEVRGDRPYLGGQRIDLWGIRCGNALMSDAVTERHVRCLDNMTAHGINCVGCYVQGSNGGWPDVNAGRDGFTPEGALRPEFARRLEWLIREADRCGMVVMVGVLSPRKDTDLKDEAALRRAVEETAKLLSRRNLRNVFVDLCHEYNAERIRSRLDHDILHEPDGPAKKAKLTKWFKAFAPDVPAGVCPSWKTGTADSYPGMDVRIIQKGADVPDKGFVVNVETLREDTYDNDGVFTPEAKARMVATWEKYRGKPNAFLLFHAAYVQGITNKSGTAPHPEMGGDGTGPDDRGVRFYYEWVKENVGPYQYPQHAKGRAKG
jgi:hypothetical protein